MSSSADGLERPGQSANRFRTLRVEVAEGVGTLTLNRPEAHNAINLTLGRELHEAALELCDDRAVRCIVITGSGRAFCSGGDVKDFAAAVGGSGEPIATLLHRLTTELHGALARLYHAAKPVVVGLNGVAAGGGFGLALAGDLCIAAESAKLVMAYAKIAATPDGGSTYYLARLVGVRRAMELYLLGRTLSAREALDWGLVNRVVPDAELPATLAAIGRELASGPTLACARTRRLLHDAFTETFESQLADEAETIVASGQTADFRAGVTAFADKRPPRFEGA